MEEKPEPGENIKVVVRVRDLIAREKDQPKVLSMLFIGLLHFHYPIKAFEIFLS